VYVEKYIILIANGIGLMRLPGDENITSFRDVLSVAKHNGKCPVYEYASV
jgi:hypothetical protein